MMHIAQWRGHAWVALAFRLYLAAVFLFACWRKIVDPASFALDVATYQILPLWTINIFAITLPWIELAVGVGLLVGFRARASALLVAGMMVMFTIAVAIALSKNLTMSCGCFASQGMDDDPISMLTVLRDVSWLALAAYVVIFDRRPLGVDRLIPGFNKNE